MIICLVALVVAAVDPLEGSLVLFPATGVVALVARRAKSRYQRLLVGGLVLFAFGFVAMWAMSAIGGLGGDTGRSMWWALLLVPMLPGWLLSVVGTVLALRERTPTAVPPTSQASESGH